jgi:hypothetical protein
LAKQRLVGINSELFAFSEDLAMAAATLFFLAVMVFF